MYEDLKNFIKRSFSDFERGFSWGFFYGCVFVVLILIFIAAS